MSGVGIVILGLAVAGVGIQLFRTDYTDFTVSTKSMQPIAEPGDDILFRSAGPLTPHRGDLVLSVQPPSGILVVRRVIGLPGDTIACCDEQHRLTVNGRKVTEDYVHSDPTLPADAPTYRPFDAQVPDGQVFLAGDNRGNSDDSRFLGPVPLADVVGIAVTGWPFVVGYRSIPVATAFVAAGLPGPATEDTGYLPDVGLVLGGAVLGLGGLIVLLVGALRGRQRQA